MVSDVKDKFEKMSVDQLLQRRTGRNFYKIKSGLTTTTNGISVEHMKDDPLLTSSQPYLMSLEPFDSNKNVKSKRYTVF